MAMLNGAPAEPDPFPVSWEDPGDAERSWERDDMHWPFALTPLAAEWVRVIGQGFNLAPVLFGGFPQRWHARIWNGYAYLGRDANVAEADRAELSDRWVAMSRERAEVTAAYWSDEVLPELRLLEAQIRATPVETMDRADLAAAWDRAWAAAERMWQLHFCLIIGPYQILEDLADLYDAVVPGASPGEALRLVQGSRHELLDMELGMEHLATYAGAHPAIREALIARASSSGPSREPMGLDEARALPHGPAFLLELDAILTQHGHLGQGFDDLGLPSWVEEPSLVLAQLGMRLANPPEPAEARRVRLEAEATSLADAVRARLINQPDEVTKFERLLRLAREIGPLTEVHNYWIDRMAQARIRAFSMRVGGRLAQEGCFAAADDVLYLDRTEIRERLQRPSDVRSLIAERRAEHARHGTVKPPRTLGLVRTGEPDRFDGERFVSTEPDVLQGTGASAGVARGLARVTLSPADFGRIGAGDIIVCPSSNPSWVPVFTIAAGLVTNTGGILSHAAVVAREFGLPAVVGTGDATTRIADGRLVEIDGSTGFVRLL